MKQMRRFPWIGQQEWHDVLFLHWPVAIKELRPFVADPFKIDTFDGQAWITIILFQAENSRLRGMPRLASYPTFLQMNVRTYVTFNDEPGIYFFSIDANDPLVVAVAKMAVLPYRLAKMGMVRTKSGIIFNSRHTGSHIGSASLSASYEPLPELVYNQKGTLSYWLTERYNLWVIKGTKVLKGPISHQHWILQKANTNVQMTSMLPFLPDVSVPKTPFVHYSKSIQAHLHPFEQAGIFYS